MFSGGKKVKYAKEDLNQDEWVYIKTPAGQVKLKANLSTKTQPGVVFTEFGWWQDCEELGMPGYDPFSEEGANINLILSDEQKDPVSGTIPIGYHSCNLCKS